MIIEKGDYFVITRGVKVRNTFYPFSAFLGMEGESWKQNNHEEEHYDRSFHDCVFIAHEVCGQMVAAEILAGDEYCVSKHKKLSLNLDEIEVMTVTKEYVDSLK